MTSIQQRAALQRQIWPFANDVRDSVCDWDTKQSMLGTLFFSENITAKLEAHAPDSCAVVDTMVLNAELKTTVAKIDRLQAGVDASVSEIEGSKS